MPSVLGAVDDREDLPAPFFLMERASGRSVLRTEMESLPEGTVAWIARRSGELLAEVHGLDAVDAFGHVEHDPSRPLDGGRPPGDADQVVVADPEASWPAWLRAEAETALDALSERRFADVVPRAREAVTERIDRLSGPFDPAMCRIDHSLDNLLLDPSSRSVTAVLDWGFALAASPAYDLVFAVHSLSGGPWAKVPSTPDYAPPIRGAVVEGYRDDGSTTALAEFHEHRGLYELLSCLHSMLHFEDRLSMDGASRDQIEGAAERHREVVARYC